MKNNLIFFAFGLSMLSTQSYASAPYFAQASKGGPASSSSSSSMSSAVKESYEMATQTENDDQVYAQIEGVLRNADNDVIRLTETKLSKIADEASDGSITHACAIARFRAIVEDSSDDEGVPVADSEDIFPILHAAGLLQKPMMSGYRVPCHVVRMEIRSAFRERRETIKKAAKKIQKDSKNK